MINTAGTKTAAILSTKRPIAGLLDWALRTKSIIRAKAVSRPMPVALIKNVPLLLSVPPNTGLSLLFSIAIGSPVSMDSSTNDCPSITRPSTGIFSPGRTRKVSSKPTSSMGISISLPLRTARAVLGCKPIKRLMAAEVLPRALVSKAAPKETRAIIMIADSKYTCRAILGMASGNKIIRVEYSQAVPVPIATRLSILPRRFLRAVHAPRKK